MTLPPNWYRGTASGCGVGRCEYPNDSRDAGPSRVRQSLPVAPAVAVSTGFNPCLRAINADGSPESTASSTKEGGLSLIRWSPSLNAE